MPRAPHVDDALLALRRRLASGLHRPGDRFLSNRAVATQFGVSYQTAHRLLNRLVEEGLLRRRDRSGTYLPGEADRPTAVELIFHPRAEVPGSFGNKLLAAVRDELTRIGLDPAVTFTESATLLPRRLHVLWEAPEAATACLERGRRAILLNDRPRPGLDSRLIDSVATDDFAGGVAAAQYLRRVLGSRPRCVVLGGPPRDSRSRSRVAGFTSELPAKVIHARTWYEPAAEAVAPRVLGHRPTAIFCCNDRLAEGLLRVCAARGATPPTVVGFDDAPVAAMLNLTTVAIPWPALAEAVARVAADRLAGRTYPASHLVFHPHLVVRG